MNQVTLIDNLKKIQNKVDRGTFVPDEAVVLIAELESGTTAIHIITGDNVVISSAALLTIQVFLESYAETEKEAIKEYLLQEIQKM